MPVSELKHDRELKTTRGIKIPNQTRLKQVVPHSVFGMRNSLLLYFDHHWRGEGARARRIDGTNLLKLRAR